MRGQPTAEDLGGGVWSIPVPIPGSPLGYTLVYALESQRGLVLIDAGWQHADSWEALIKGLGAFGFEVADVYGVVVTHYHPDHSGLAGRIREASGAWIAMHAADAALIPRFHRLSPATLHDWEIAELRRAGASRAEIGRASLATGRHRYFDAPAIPDRELTDGDLADVPGRTLRVVWTPGHSPGHICLYLADGDRLFTGDHVLPKITPNIGIYAFEQTDGDPLTDFLSSLDRVAKIGAKEALPAHEYRFTDVPARAAVIAEHHESRLREVAAILSERSAPHRTAPRGTAAACGTAAGTASGIATDGPAVRGGVPAGDARSVTLWDVASRMGWNVPWADMHLSQRRLAASEAAAHLRLLERRGSARQLPGSDPMRYVAIAGRPIPH